MMENVATEQSTLEEVKKFLNHRDLRIDVKREKGGIESIVITRWGLNGQSRESNLQTKGSITKTELEKEITGMLIKLGMPAHLHGFSYVREAILWAYEDIEVVSSVTKLLYPVIAKKFKTSDSKVERAIRNSIEVAWRRADVKIIYEIFGNTVDPMKGRPTNSEFIAMFADVLKLKYKI